MGVQGHGSCMRLIATASMKKVIAQNLAVFVDVCLHNKGLVPSVLISGILTLA